MVQMKNGDKLIDWIGEIIYSIRFALVPMYLLLWVVLIAYNVQFAREIFDFLFILKPGTWLPCLRVNDSTHYLLFILSLIDITMIGNLVVMTTVGGFSTFVKEFNLGKLDGRPRWMNGLDSTTLKNKMGMSLVGVSAIHLLVTFMENVEKFSAMTEDATKIAWRTISIAEAQALQIGFAVKGGLMAANTAIQIIIHIVFIVTTLAFAMNSKLMHGHTPKPSDINDQPAPSHH